MKPEEIEQYRAELVKKYQLIIQEDRLAYIEYQDFLNKVEEIEQIKQKIKALKTKIKEYEARLRLLTLE